MRSSGNVILSPGALDFRVNFLVIFVDLPTTKCTRKHKKRFTDISSSDTKILTSAVMRLFCVRLLRDKSIRSSVDLQLMELKIYVAVTVLRSLFLW